MSPGTIVCPLASILLSDMYFAFISSEEPTSKNLPSFMAKASAFPKSSLTV